MAGIPKSRKSSVKPKEVRDWKRILYQQYYMLRFAILLISTPGINYLNMTKMETTKLVYFFVLHITTMIGLAVGLNTTISVNVGVLLDTETYLGKMGLTCINMALSDFYNSHSYYKTRLVLNTRNSGTQVLAAASAAAGLIKNAQVQAIIGPQYSKQASVVIDVGEKAQVPVISFSATSPSLTSPGTGSPYFFRMAQNGAVQAQAISAIVQAFQWKEAVPIYSEGLYGGEVIASITRALQEANVRVPYLGAISPSATDQQIVEELYKLRAMSNRVFIVHMSPTLGSHLFARAREIEMMREGYVWIMTTEMGNLLGHMNFSTGDSMNGVLGVSTYFPMTKGLEEFEARWQLKFQQENPIITGAELNVIGLWAYDAAIALAMTVEKAGTTNSSFQKTNASSNATDFQVVGLISQGGPKLREEISKIRFKGLTGEISLVNREINSSIFQIINVFGDGKRRVGFWTPQNGLTRQLDSKMTNTTTYSTSKANLGPIIWPGDTSSVPKGWDVLATVKKLRVGVPVKVKDGFVNLVHVHNNPGSNVVNISGYCIDLFEAVMEALPYDVHYEFIPFYKSNHDELGPRSYYDDLTYQVYLGSLGTQRLDAVVGDITIMARRARYVDFTLPFTGNEASFLVPTKEKNKSKAWIFLKPLTWELWLTTVCFFVFVGFVVWILEHRINQEFRGSPSHQIGTSFWFSFSTLVFAQMERVQSNLARFVVLVWLFVVLILTQSYTASLTTLLTVQQLRPAVTDVDQLIQSGDSVGYQVGSYAMELLKNIGIDERRLQPYSSPEECDRLLSIGSKNGGIAAAFDEIPYINLIRESYCSKYTTMGPTYITEGFGFAFKRGSPLVPDVSRAILNLREEHPDTMKAIEDKWFKNETRCLQPSEIDTSYSLDLDSFRGLFLLAGIASASALIIYTVMFLHRHRMLLKQFDPKDSLWKRLWVMFRIFDQKDTSFSGSENNREDNPRSTLGDTQSPTSTPLNLDHDPNPNGKQSQENI